MFYAILFATLSLAQGLTTEDKDLFCAQLSYESELSQFEFTKSDAMTIATKQLEEAADVMEVRLFAISSEMTKRELKRNREMLNAKRKMILLARSHAVKYRLKAENAQSLGQVLSFSLRRLRNKEKHELTATCVRKIEEVEKFVQDYDALEAQIIKAFKTADDLGSPKHKRTLNPDP